MTSVNSRTLRAWLLILALGIALLYLRFDWNIANGTVAKQAFLMSAYLFVIMLPTVYYLSLRLLHHRRAATILTGTLFVIFTVPYQLLGLNSLYYYATHPLYLPYSAFPPKLEFLPGGSLGTFPLDWLFMPLLFLAGVGCVFLIRWVRSLAGFRIGRRIPLLLTLAFAAICLQAFLHTGMRSPYTYLSYFQEPQSAQHWYFVRHFSDGSGETEGDEWTYIPIERLFQGRPNPGDDMLIRRPFGFYLEAQFGYFFNDFYCWLALNCLFWLAAVFAVGRLVTRLTSPRVGLIAAALTVFGPGFIAFVGTPSMYMENFATAAIALCAFEDLIVSPIDGRQRQFALFTGLLALCALVYDLEPLFLVLFLYGIVRHVPWRPLLASLVVALALMLGFAQLVTVVLHITIDQMNNGQIGQSVHAVEHLIFHPNLAVWNDTFITVVSKFLQMWLQAYFIIPAVLAVFGWGLLRDRGQRVLVGSLFLVSLGTMSLFYIGQTSIATTPRILYPDFVGVYLPAALALDAAGRGLAKLLSPRRIGDYTIGGAKLAARALQVTPWLPVALMAVLVNIDIFGNPTQYVEFFVNTPPLFLP